MSCQVQWFRAFCLFFNCLYALGVDLRGKNKHLDGKAHRRVRPARARMSCPHCGCASLRATLSISPPFGYVSMFVCLRVTLSVGLCVSRPRSVLSFSVPVSLCCAVACSLNAWRDGVVCSLGKRIGFLSQGQPILLNPMSKVLCGRWGSNPRP